MNNLEKNNQRPSFKEFLETLKFSGESKSDALHVFYPADSKSNKYLVGSLTSELRRFLPGEKVEYATLDQFTDSYVQAVQENNLKPFKEKYSNSDILVLRVRDVEFFVGKEMTAEELFHTCNRFSERDKKVIFIMNSGDDWDRFIQIISDKRFRKLLERASVHEIV